MALVPDRMLIIREQIEMMSENLKKISFNINQHELNHPEHPKQVNTKLNEASTNETSEMKIHIKTEPLNENNSSPSSSTSSLVVQSSPQPSSSSLDQDYKPAVANDPDSNQDSSIKQESHDLNNKNSIQNSNSGQSVRQLRSNKSSSSSLSNLNSVNSLKRENEQSKANTNTNESKCNHFEVMFNVNTNELINELVENYNNQETSINKNIIVDNLKFKNELNKLLDKLDLVDLSKLFKIDLIKHLFKLNSNIAKLNGNGNGNCLSDSSENKEVNGNNSDANHEEMNSDSQDMNESNGTDSSGYLFKRLASIDDLKQIEAKLKVEIESDESKYNDEIEKRKKYKVNIKFLVKKHNQELEY
jgi:hypothetical protein